MLIKSANFLISNTDVGKLPAPNLPEYAFIGRSNVGKSSLINMLTERKALAKVSGKPGKTKLINHFVINENWYLVDLPGYGYAKSSKKDRGSWQKFIRQYFMKRTNLVSAFVLLDARIPPQKIDLEFMAWLGQNGIPFSMVFTKIDKLSSNEHQKNLAAYRKEMLKTWEAVPTAFSTSATSKHGRDEVLQYIDHHNGLLGEKIAKGMF